VAIDQVWALIAVYASVRFPYRGSLVVDANWALVPIGMFHGDVEAKGQSRASRPAGDGGAVVGVGAGAVVGGAVVGGAVVGGAVVGGAVVGGTVVGGTVVGDPPVAR
jgi:hypothetical protein